MKWLTNALFLGALIWSTALSGAGSSARHQPGDLESSAWVHALNEMLAQVQAGYPGELGVYVLDLDSGESVSMRAEEMWYLASGVKVPVAIAVIRMIENGALTLDSELVLRIDDYVDGAGATNRHRPGSRLSVRFLIEQMLIHSDNTATDMLIRHVGLDQVNVIAQELQAQRAGAITTLADVRRHVYSRLHGDAFRLTGNDLLALRRAAAGSPRIDRLSELLGVPRTDFLLGSLDQAFDAYYATSLNAAPLQAFGQLLATVAEGRALGPDGTGYLLDVLSRVVTGERRIKAGLPGSTIFAHKTGTQHQRVCDLGIALSGDREGGRRVVVAACTRGPVALARSERVLREVGAAVAASGVLDAGPDSKARNLGHVERR